MLTISNSLKSLVRILSKYSCLSNTAVKGWNIQFQQLETHNSFLEFVAHHVIFWGRFPCMRHTGQVGWNGDSSVTTEVRAKTTIVEEEGNWGKLGFLGAHTEQQRTWYYKTNQYTQKKGRVTVDTPAKNDQNLEIREA